MFSPQVRLCHLRKWDNFPGYGFSLLWQNAEQGHHIKEVDQNSPAFHGGIRNGDCVLEVNGETISGDNHEDVVAKILSNPSETVLLVVDPLSREYFAKNHIVVDSFIENVIKLYSGASPDDPKSNGATFDMYKNGNTTDSYEAPVTDKPVSNSNTDDNLKQALKELDAATRADEPVLDEIKMPTHERKVSFHEDENFTTSEDQRLVIDSAACDTQQNGDSSLEINVQEFRARLAARKKKRNMAQTTSFEKRRTIFENL